MHHRACLTLTVCVRVVIAFLAVGIGVAPGRLAAQEAEKAETQGRVYVTVPLDAVCNAGGLLDAASLPPGGVESVIEGIPLVFPVRGEGVEHVDVGESIFAFRTDHGSGYEFTARTWPWPNSSGPGRIMFPVPKHARADHPVLSARQGLAAGLCRAGARVHW